MDGITIFLIVLVVIIIAIAIIAIIIVSINTKSPPPPPPPPPPPTMDNIKKAEQSFLTHCPHHPSSANMHQAELQLPEMGAPLHPPNPPLPLNPNHLDQAVQIQPCFLPNHRAVVNHPASVITAPITTPSAPVLPVPRNRPLKIEEANPHLTIPTPMTGISEPRVPVLRTHKPGHEPVKEPVTYYPYRDICWYRGYYIILTYHHLIVSKTPTVSMTGNHDGTKYRRVFVYQDNLYVLLTMGMIKQVMMNDDMTLGPLINLKAVPMFPDRYERVSVSHDGETIKLQLMGDPPYPYTIMGRNEHHYAIVDTTITVYDNDDIMTIKPDSPNTRIKDLVLLDDGDIITIQSDNKSPSAVRYCRSDEEIYYLI